MRDQIGDAGSTHDRDWDSPAKIGEAIGHPYVVEILDVLSKGRPMALGYIQSSVRAGRRAVVAALRVAAANGLVAGSGGGGSWDVIAPGSRWYRITDRGMRLVEKLSSLAVWETVIDGPDPEVSDF